jgi:ATP-dependent DNA helicase RecQ
VARNRRQVRLLVDDFEPAEVSLDSEERRHAYERSRVEMMRTYAELRDCRRRFILNYFGEASESDRCERCDNDLRPIDSNRPIDPARPADPPTSSDGLAFAVNQPLQHQSWGRGLVQHVTPDTLVVLFDSVGYKTFDLQLALELGVLSA